MPKSRIRKKVKQDRTVQAQVVQATPEPTESPKWLAPVMLAAFLLGLAWIVVYYITQTKYPIPSLGAWNMGIGFVFIGIGFSLATRWR
ncbi:MAG: cell division protein CrgA [Actinomycetes bacterium]|nr:cell division protein CrgA [Actinomycetota bacterium]